MSILELPLELQAEIFKDLSPKNSFNYFTTNWRAYRLSDNEVFLSHLLRLKTGLVIEGMGWNDFVYLNQLFSRAKVLAEEGIDEPYNRSHESHMYEMECMRSRRGFSGLNDRFLDLFTEAASTGSRLIVDYILGLCVPKGEIDSIWARLEETNLRKMIGVNW